MSAAAIQANKLRFAWEDAAEEARRGAPDAALFDNLSFDLAAGSFTAIIGASGCGKTSLLRLLAGFARPQSGRLSAAPRRIGYVFQDAGLMEWKSIFDNVALPLSLAGVARPQIATRVERALANVGLKAAGALYPRQLSGGMKMRAALARALIDEPDLLLMDEPFAALDELTREQLEDDLYALWRARRCTIVLVTHSLSESAYLAERILVLSRARQGLFASCRGRSARAAHKNYRDTPAFQRSCVRLRHLLEQAGGAAA